MGLATQKQVCDRFCCNRVRRFLGVSTWSSLSKYARRLTLLRDKNYELDIAVVGMACRFPGARNLDEFWHNLVEGVESITRFSDEELLRSGVPAACLSNPNYVKAAPILEEPGQFDADFFGFLPTEARTIDPQHRILLELAHEAIEEAGYDPNRYPGRIGVFTGSAFNTYFMDRGLSSQFAQDYIPTLIDSDKDFLSTRISYKLNLKGPSLTIQTACSTSMVAVHLARQSLLNGESDMALAGATFLCESLIERVTFVKRRWRGGFAGRACKGRRL